MFCKKQKRLAFTLVELAVVITIISMLVSAVLVSRNLITTSRLNKLQSEFLQLKNAVIMFNNANNCLAGDCLKSSLSSLSAKNVDLIPQICFDSKRVNLGDHIIKSDTKRACAMRELLASGLIDGLSQNHGKDQQIEEKNVTTAGLFIPASKAFPTNVLNLFSLSTQPLIPLELRSKTFEANYGWHVILLHGLNATNPDATSLDSANKEKFPSYALDPTSARKFDIKFDDGIPYSGYIVGARIPSSEDGTSLAAGECNDAGGLNLAIIAKGDHYFTKDIKYLDSKDKSKGCVMAFLFSF